MSVFWPLAIHRASARVAAPLVAVVRGPLAGRRAWVFLVYYLAIQVPVFSVYAWTWHIASLAKGSETNLVNAFALQFVQPVLWFR